MMTEKQLPINYDGRCCSICGHYKVIYHEVDCMGTWTSESECSLGYDLEETDGTECKDFILDSSPISMEVINDE